VWQGVLGHKPCLRKEMGAWGRKVREYWSGGLGGNILISVSINVHYGRLLCGEIANFCNYLLGSVSL
jgi:hypothetical protein